MNRSGNDIDIRAYHNALRKYQETLHELHLDGY
jgi:hypothetical protein